MTILQLAEVLNDVEKILRLEPKKVYLESELIQYSYGQTADTHQFTLGCCNPYIPDMGTPTNVDGGDFSNYFTTMNRSDVISINLQTHHLLLKGVFDRKIGSYATQGLS